jgi:cytochrome c peroxidase
MMMTNGRRRPGVRRLGQGVVALGLGLLVAACGGGGGSASSASGSTALSAQAALGEKIFKDESLSASGLQSCASCHDPARAHAGPAMQHGVQASSLVTEPGGVTLGAQEGNRVSPSIRYLVANRAFRFETDGTPTGGFFWDGRATSLADQARGPFVNPREMANSAPADVIAKLRLASYASEFKAVFGSDAFDDVDAAYTRMTVAIAAYERESAEFSPFTSKYDAYLRGQVKLSDAEMRGLALFNSSSKGNCAACHPSARGSDGSFPLFTDFSYDNLGVPRNWAIVDNADSTVFDLGLCQSAALDGVAQSKKDSLCGAFKVPSLRNVAARKAYFHNGRFTDLKEALRFYVQRDTNPEKWYLKADGVTVDDKFNDLPAQYRGNVNRTEVPYNRNPGDQPALTDAEIDDLFAFLNTLTDGYTQ